MSTFLLFFLLAVLAGWVYRSGRSLSELRQAPTLKLTGNAARRGRVSVLIPAKNEEKNIAACVTPFLGQLRKGDELIVINNSSTDGTEAILRELGAFEIKRGQAGFSGTGSPVKQGACPPQKNQPVPFFGYLNTPPTPEGWTGKNFALDLGVRHATGDWFLFTDADTRHAPGSVHASVAFAEEKKLGLLTLLPRCLAQGFWENLVQPCAMAYMGLWFPVKKINDPKSRVYFGNGQYLLLKADHYRSLGGHAAVKEAFLEDFAFMKKTKEAGVPGLCAFGMEIYGTRMYDSLGALWRGWRRIFLHAFDRRPGLILKRLLSVLIFSVFPFLAFAALPAKVSFSLLLALVITVIIFATAFTAYGIVKADRRYALLHPFAALVFTAILADALQMALLKRRTFWR